FHDGLASFTIDMECDQCGREPLVVRFYLGPKNDLSNLMAAKEEAPLGHPILVGRWAEPLQDVIWYGLLDLVSETTPDSMAIGIGADEGNLWIRIDTNADSNASARAILPSRIMMSKTMIEGRSESLALLSKGGGRK
ncbi:MAG: hypothetical protein CXX81_07230, partial [Methanobacteriota archaeon]